MKEFEGTQGKWQLDSYGNELVIVRESDKQHILTMRTGSLPEEKKANAQLIATAPELLKALQNMLAIVDDSEGVHGYDLDGCLSFWEEFPEVEEAERVINKALGKDNK